MGSFLLLCLKSVTQQQQRQSRASGQGHVGTNLIFHIFGEHKSILPLFFFVDDGSLFRNISVMDEAFLLHVLCTNLYSSILSNMEAAEIASPIYYNLCLSFTSENVPRNFCYVVSSKVLPYISVQPTLYCSSWSQ